MVESIVTDSELSVLSPDMQSIARKEKEAEKAAEILVAQSSSPEPDRETREVAINCTVEDKDDRLATTRGPGDEADMFNA